MIDHGDLDVERKVEDSKMVEQKVETGLGDLKDLNDDVVEIVEDKMACDKLRTGY